MFGRLRPFHYRAVERAWRNADPQFTERYEHARTQLVCS
jgi:hypothetical protein